MATLVPQGLYALFAFCLVFSLALAMGLYVGRSLREVREEHKRKFWAGYTVIKQANQNVCAGYEQSADLGSSESISSRERLQEAASSARQPSGASLIVRTLETLKDVNIATTPTQREYGQSLSAHASGHQALATHSQSLVVPVLRATSPFHQPMALRHKGSTSDRDRTPTPTGTGAARLLYAAPPSISQAFRAIRSPHGAVSHSSRFVTARDDHTAHSPRPSSHTPPSSPLSSPPSSPVDSVSRLTHNVTLPSPTVSSQVRGLLDFSYHAQTQEGAGEHNRPEFVPFLNSSGDHLLSAPPEWASRGASVGIVLFHVVETSSPRKHQFWLRDSDVFGTAYWKPIELGYRRTDGKRLILTFVNREPSWVSERWYKQTIRMELEHPELVGVRSYPKANKKTE
ncbi:hypothetical protein GY45DRAFT_1375423 [Cubamyces sp. BRFM 1775]|nr:hypothetical protein GY45DRAFT_1375423 [Cubamyces sp. BRFM 1775]